MLPSPILERLIKTARWEAKNDHEDYEDGLSGWSNADCYDSGISDGEIHAARKLLNELGIEWKR